MPGNLTRRDLARRLLGGRPDPAPVPPPAPPCSVQPVSREWHVLSRATFGRNPQVEADINAMGWQDWVLWQLNPDAIDDSAMENALRQMPGGQNARSYAQREFVFRCLNSRRQLLYRMVWFLNNHFNTDLQKTEGIAEVIENRAFAKYAFGPFRDVLLQSAKSPAMVVYLDSNENIAGSPNENYARELFELHTLGVFGGYSEQDVAEAARIFTGWSVRYTFQTGVNGATDAKFRFLPFRHDTGAKNLTGLGWSTPGMTGQAGVQEGENLIAFLATHPSTANYVIPKLCRFFVADNPPAGLVANAIAVFNHGGSLGDVVRTIFFDSEFWSTTTAREKGQDSFEFAQNAVRRLRVQTGDVRTLVDEIGRMGQPVHREAVPTGTPEDAGAWTGASNSLLRWNFIDRLVKGQVQFLAPNWTSLIPVPAPATGQAWTDAFLAILVDGDVPATTRTRLTHFMNSRLASLPPNPAPAQVLPHVQDLASLILRLPEAQVN